MKYLELQPRLKLIASLVSHGAKIIDVGTDHGYIPVYLIQNNIITHAVASDIGIEPLNHAKKTASIHDIHSIEFCVCDGLSGISLSELDTIIIAGMGGETIISILDAANNAITNHKLILQPMTKSDVLRKWLNEHHYSIIEEHLVRDKAYIYPILIVCRGEQATLTNAQLVCGINSHDDPLFDTFLEEKINSVTNALKGLKNAVNLNESKIEEYTNLLKELESIRG